MSQILQKLCLPFYNFPDTHTCTYENFELIPSKIDFFKNLKVSPKSDQVSIHVVQLYKVLGQILPKLKWREFAIFIIFPDTHTHTCTCTYFM